MAESDELQFETAEPIQLAEPTQPVEASSSVQCAGCGAAVTTYFDVNGRTACVRCKVRAVKAHGASHVPGLLRAAGLGLVAAAAGAGLYYAVAEITGYELGIISIAVGLMVGLAVKRGARGRGGWRYQALAIFLAYLAIASTYVPRVFKAVAEQEAKKAAAAAPAAAQPVALQGGAPAAAPAAPATAAEAGEPEEAEPPGVFKALALLLGFTLALPVLVGLDSPMALVLVAIALWEAWKVNRASPFSVSGPFAVAGRAAQDG